MHSSPGEQSVVHGVRCDALLLCDHAEEINGKLYIIGGAWNQLTFQQLPGTQLTIGVAVVLSIPWNDTNQELKLQLRLLDDDGRAVGPDPVIDGTLNVGRPASAPPGSDIPFVFASRLENTLFERRGTYSVTLVVNGRELRRAPFHVQALVLT